MSVALTAREPMKARTLRVAGRHPRSEPRLEDVDSASNLSLGSSPFVEDHPLKPLREWDGKNFDTYDPADRIADGFFQPRSAARSIARLRIFPVGPFGSSSTKSIRRGYL